MDSVDSYEAPQLLILFRWTYDLSLYYHVGLGTKTALHLFFFSILLLVTYCHIVCVVCVLIVYAGFSIKTTLNYLTISKVTV